MDEDDELDGPVLVIHNVLPVPFAHSVDGTCWCYPLVLTADEARQAIAQIVETGHTTVACRPLTA